VSLHAQSAATNDQARDLALTTILRRKGRALDATADSVGRLRGAATPDDRTLFDRLSNARGQLSAVTLRGPATASPATYQRALRNLQESVEALETEVAARSAAFRANARSITIDAIQAAIPPEAALIEFVLYHPTVTTEAPRPPARYAAYVLSSRGAARWTDLGEAQRIESAVARFREALRDPARGDARRLARALDTVVMQPVRSLLTDERHLLISPDSVLNLIPFAALVDEGDGFLVERYTITYLTSGRDLLRLQIRQPARAESVIVAAPAFGDPTSLAPRQVFFGPLPGATDEVRGLKPLLPRATVLVNEQATEAALKRVAGPRILHVATHGFFLGDDERNDQRGPSTASGDRTRLGRWAAWTENPLLRSGLALAGANRGKSGDDDGVLTALEAAGLDLWGTKLVVLSACDTGVGEVRQGDGVYGLRRALVVAGAESQLMSLWPVSDRSTRDLMVAYYTALTQGQGRADALREAQLKTLRERPRQHPYYWASFIQSGEWANLDGRR
jgi:CHAT domain-containing protein